MGKPGRLGSGAGGCILDTDGILPRLVNVASAKPEINKQNY